MARFGAFVSFVCLFLLSALPAQSQCGLSASASLSGETVVVTATAASSCPLANAMKVEVWAEGDYHYRDCGFPVYESPCSFTANIGTGCWTAGSHVVTVRGTCTVLENNECVTRVEETTRSVTLTSEPTVSWSGNVVGTGYQATFSYDVPRAPAAGLNIWIETPNGVLHENPRVDVLPSLTGTYGPLGVACWPAGVYDVHVELTSCSGNAESDSTFTIAPHVPTITAAPTNVTPTSLTLDGNFEFTNNTESYQRAVFAEWKNGSIENLTGVESARTGTFHKVLTDCGMVRFKAVACNDDENGTAYTNWFQIPSCDPSCTSCSLEGGPGKSAQSQGANGAGNPVNVTSGNMRLNDSDALPGLGLQRTYNSIHPAGVFGRGWTSIFDSTLQVRGPHVLIFTEKGDDVIFRKVGTEYRMVYPSVLVSDDHLLTYDDDDDVYLYRESGSTMEHVYENGRLVALRPIGGTYQIDISYDPNQLPVRVEDSRGPWGWSISTSNGRVTTILPDFLTNYTWTYTRDGSDNLITVTTPDGNWRTYTYSGNRITDARDGANHIIETHQYDGNGRATSSYGDGGEIKAIRYGLTGRVTGETASEVEYENGRVTTYYSRYITGRYRTVQIAGSCNCAAAEDTVYALDSTGRIQRQQDARGYIRLREFVGDRLIRETTGLAPNSCNPATDSQQCRLTPETLATATLAITSGTQVTEYAYADTNWPDHPTSITRPSVANPSQTTQRLLTYDAATGAVLTDSTVGWTGSPAQQETHTTTNTLYNGTEAAAFTPSAAFAAYASLPQPRGSLKSINGPRTDVQDITTIVYYPEDASVPATWRGKRAAVRNAAGQITLYESYDTFGNPIRIVDPNGAATENTFDSLGRLTSTQMLAPSGCNSTLGPCTVTNSRGYSGTGPLAIELRPDGVTSYEYDSRGRISAIERGPTPSTPQERIETTYDVGTGRKATETLRARVSNAWVTKRVQTFTYDVNDRLSQLTHGSSPALDDAVHYTYAPGGLLATVRDERHATANTVYAYDVEARLEKVTQTVDTGTIETSYDYDDHGNLIEVTDPNGNVTTYAYDDFGHMLSQVSPVSGTTSYAYDPAGNLVSTTDANSAATVRTYDVLGRVTTATSTRSSQSETITWSYDTGTLGIGRLSSMTDPTGTTAYTYDFLGHLKSETRTISGVAYATAFRYDEAGNRTRIDYPGGRIVTYTYDYTGRPLSVSAGATTIVSSANYLPFGPVTEVVYGNGTTKTMTYDGRYQPLTNVLTAGASTLASYAYSYDPTGNITAITDQTDATYNRTFAYDDLNRLITADTGASLWGTGSYAYDAMGNMQSADLGTDSRTFSYSGTTPRLTSVVENGVTRSVSYDSAGNETAVGTTTSAYSPRNHLGTYGAARYSYDGRGIRTASIVDGLLAELNAATSIGGGYVQQGTVVLAQPAPVGGVTVNLSSTNSAATVPSTVTVPASATSASFNITTTAVVSATSGVITATHGDVTLTSNLQVQPAVLDQVSIPATIRGGTTANGTVSLTAHALSGGAIVSLSSSNTTYLTVPSTVTIPAGSDSVSFTVTTPLAVASATSATVTATLNGNTDTADVSVVPPAISSLIITPTTGEGGSQFTATVTLESAAAAGTQVTFSSTSGALHAPSPLTFTTGATSAQTTVTSDYVESATSAVLTASLAPSSQTATVTLQPLSLTLSTLSITPTSMIGSNYGTGTVTLTAAAPTGGIDVELSPFENGIVPPYVHVEAGNTQATFPIRTELVASSTSVTISARHAATTRTQTLTVLPPVDGDIFSFSLQDISVWGTVPPNDSIPFITGRTSGSGSQSATLQSSSPLVLSVPSTTIFNNGVTSGSFTGTTYNVSVPTDVTVTGTYRGMVARQRVTVDDSGLPVVTAMVVSSVIGGNDVEVAIALNVPAPYGGYTVTLTGSRPGLASVPATVTVPEGEEGTTFTITTQPTTTTRGVLVQTVDGTVIRSAVFAVTPPPALRHDSPVSTIATVSDPLIPMTSAATPRVATNTIPVAVSKYSFYTPVLQLLAETAPTNLIDKPITYEYIWFAGIPAAQIESATNTIHYYFNDHLGTPILTTSSAATVDWRVEREPYGTTTVVRTGAARYQPLAFPGQEVVDDRAYNVFRWYRAGWGRYTQGDPIDQPGFEYSYGVGNPVLYSDALGLKDTSGFLKKPPGFLSKCLAKVPVIGKLAGPIGVIYSIFSADDIDQNGEAPKGCDSCADAQAEPDDPPDNVKPFPKPSPIPPDGPCDKRWFKSVMWIQANIPDDWQANQMIEDANKAYKHCKDGLPTIFPGGF